MSKWQCHQLLFGSRSNGHLPQVSPLFVKKSDMRWAWGLYTNLAFTLELSKPTKTSGRRSIRCCAFSHYIKWPSIPWNAICISNQKHFLSVISVPSLRWEVKLGLYRDKCICWKVVQEYLVEWWAGSCVKEAFYLLCLSAVTIVCAEVDLTR